MKNQKFSVFSCWQRKTFPTVYQPINYTISFGGFLGNGRDANWIKTLQLIFPNTFFRETVVSSTPILIIGTPIVQTGVLLHRIGLFKQRLSCKTFPGNGSPYLLVQFCKHPSSKMSRICELFHRNMTAKNFVAQMLEWSLFSGKNLGSITIPVSAKVRISNHITSTNHPAASRKLQSYTKLTVIK